MSRSRATISTAVAMGSLHPTDLEQDRELQRLASSPVPAVGARGNAAQVGLLAPHRTQSVGKEKSRRRGAVGSSAFHHSICLGSCQESRRLSHRR
jgi:hypothetical protein